MTVSPVGNPWKKFGTPDATYDGMSDPSPPRILETSPARSLIIPLLALDVLVASQAAGEAVIKGCSGVAARAAAAGSRGAEEAEMMGRRANSRGGRAFHIMMAVIVADPHLGGTVRSCVCCALHCQSSKRRASRRK